MKYICGKFSATGPLSNQHKYNAGLYLCWFEKGLWPKIYHKYISVFRISVEEMIKIYNNQAVNIPEYS